MKNFRLNKYAAKFGMLLAIFAGALSLAWSCRKPNADEKKVYRKNDLKIEQGAVNKDVADFLADAADARLMGELEGTLAVGRGTTAALRNYGKLMQKDQAKMMDAIKKLAKSRNITLPKMISANKQDGLNDLEKKNGADFDSKFIKMMKIDHERDLKKFKDASQLTDSGIKRFTEEYLPMIQSHLDKVNLLKDKD